MATGETEAELLKAYSIEQDGSYGGMGICSAGGS